MRCAIVLACVFFLSAMAASTSPAFAQQGAWRVTAREGVVRVRQPGEEQMDAAANQTLRAGTTVTTGAASRATLENGAQRMVMTPNSRMTIAADSSNAMTRILQDLGAIMFQVDHRESQHFRVETPLLAAIVKGTTFTISAGPQEDMIHVSQGLVEVHANASDASYDVASGVTARVARGAPAAIATIAPGEPGSVAEAVALPALDYAAASGGVVEGPAANGMSHRDQNAASAGSGASANGNGGGSNIFGQSVAAVRSFFDSMTGNGGISAAAQQGASSNAGGNGNIPVVGGGSGNGNIPVVGGGSGNGNIPVVGGGSGNGNIPVVGGGSGNGNIPVVGGGSGSGNVPVVGGGSGNGGAPVPPVCRGRLCG